MNNLDLWPLVWQTLESLNVHYGPAIDHAAEELGIPVGEWYGWLMAARIFEPEPVSARLLHVRNAYTNPIKLDGHLAKGVRLGLLDPGAGGEYRLTPAGHAGVEHLIQTAWAAMNKLSPLPPASLVRLAALLQRVSDACLTAPEPPGNWCMRTTRRYDPGIDAPVMERLDQYLSDLAAYRDDSHLAAWRPYGVTGQAWEAFTLLWRGAATTLDEISERLARRGYAREEYAAALQELIRKGWVSGDETGYSLTEQGETLRQEAEATTDRYFYAPWDCLSESETVELRALLAQLCDALAQVSA